MNFARFSVTRPVAVTMRIASLVLLDAICLTKLPVVSTLCDDLDSFFQKQRKEKQNADSKTSTPSGTPPETTGAHSE